MGLDRKVYHKGLKGIMMGYMEGNVKNPCRIDITIYR
jgi:hypothetical protein